MNYKEINNNFINNFKYERLAKPTRNPGISALLSFAIMGSGQIYSGAIEKGLILMLLQLITILLLYNYFMQGFVFQFLSGLNNKFLSFSIIFAYSLVYITIWIYNVKDAYKLAAIADIRDLYSLQHNWQNYLLPSYDNHCYNDNNQTFTFVEINKQCLENNKKNYIRYVLLYNAIFILVAILLWSFYLFSLYQSNNSLSNQSKFDNISYTNLNKLKTESYNVDTNTNLQKYCSINIPELCCASTTVSATSISHNFSYANKDTNSKNITSSLLQITEIHSLISDLHNANKIASCVEILEEITQINASEAKIAWSKFLICCENLYKNKNQINDEIYYSIIDKYLSFYPDDFKRLLELAKYQYTKNDIINSINNLLKVLQLDPNNSEANYTIASIYHKLTLYNDALPYINNLLKYDPLNPKHLKLAVYTYSALNDFETAENLLHKLNLVYANLGIVDEEYNNLLNIITNAKNNNNYNYKELENKKNNFIKVESTLLEQAKKEQVITTISDLPSSNSKGAILYEANDDNIQSILDSSNKNINHQNSSVYHLVNSNKNLFESEENYDIPGSNIIINSQNSNKVNSNFSNSTLNIFPNIINKNYNFANNDNCTLKIHTNDNLEDLKKNKQPTLEVSLNSLDDFIAFSFSDLNSNKIISSNSLELQIDNIDITNNNYADIKNIPKANPSKIQEFWNSGIKNFMQGQLEDALECLLNFVKENPCTYGYEMVGLVFERLGMLEDAYKAYIMSYQLGQRNFNFLLKLAKLAYKNGDSKAVSNFIIELYSKYPHRRAFIKNFENTFLNSNYSSKISSYTIFQTINLNMR